MPEIVLSCTCCGLKYALPEGCDLLDCPACGTRNARPQVEGPTLDALQRAVEQRVACDFANAEESYQQVLRAYPNNHEALWGNLLCQYGVEYVTDPKTGRRMPTVHTVRRRPMRLTADFRAACRHAPAEIAAQYERDAEYIDEAQSAIRQQAESCPSYDVFLCHKTTRPGTEEKTQDYHEAFQLYVYLKDMGVRAFFAPECLTAVAGANYEAGIYHALHTAPLMLLVCSDADYLTSPWVRSEWSRYLSLMDEGEDKRLAPLLYGGFGAGDLPAEIRYHNLQGIQMGQFSSKDRVTEVVRKVLGIASEAAHRKAAAPSAKEPPSPRPEPKEPAKATPKQPPKAASPKPAAAVKPKTEARQTSKPAASKPAASKGGSGKAQKGVAKQGADKKTVPFLPPKETREQKEFVSNVVWIPFLSFIGFLLFAIFDNVSDTMTVIGQLLMLTAIPGLFMYRGAGIWYFFGVITLVALGALGVGVYRSLNGLASQFDDVPELLNIPGWFQ